MCKLHFVLATSFALGLFGCDRGSSKTANTTAPATQSAAPNDQTGKEIAAYTDAIRANPRAVNERGELAYGNRGHALAAKGEYDKAIADFTEALRLYPLIKSPYLNARLIETRDARGDAYRSNGDFDHAILDYTEVVGLGDIISQNAMEVLAFGSFAAHAHYKLGICFDAKGQGDKALPEYKEAVRREPSLMNDELRKRLKP